LQTSFCWLKLCQYCQYDSTPFDKHGRPRGDPNFGKAKKVANDEAPFDEFGRKRGDPLFGKPHGYVETDDSDDGSYDGSGVDSDNSDDSESDEDDSSEEEEVRWRLCDFSRSSMIVA
jgi:hypothetical protein